MKKIILVGFMGSGKSTLGKKLASRLKIPFIDSDHEIERHYQRSIGELFALHGESHFREIEAAFIDSLSTKDSFVLATGGGMPCFGKNMEKLNALGTTFYLERTAAELSHRLSHAKEKRPLIEGLQEVELLEFIHEKLKEREDFYRHAQVILDRSEQNTDAILRMIHLLHPAQKN